MEEAKKKKIRLNQTVIKQLKAFNMSEPNFCPAQIRHLSFSEELVSLPPTAAMKKGIVFETLALGLDPRPNGESEIPLLKNGQIPVDYARIKEQVKKFDELRVTYGLFPYRVQETMVYDYSDEIELFGTIDFASRINVDGVQHPNAIIDLKLTGDINNQFGSFSWAFPHLMDHTQALMYVYLYEKIYGERLPFFYMVFDYSPKKGYKILQKKVGEQELAQLHESIALAQQKLKFLQDNEWMEIPEKKRCEFCPLRLTCKSYDGRSDDNEDLRQLLIDLT